MGLRLFELSGFRCSSFLSLGVSGFTALASLGLRVLRSRVPRNFLPAFWGLEFRVAQVQFQFSLSWSAWEMRIQHKQKLRTS